MNKSVYTISTPESILPFVIELEPRLELFLSADPVFIYLRLGATPSRTCRVLFGVHVKRAQVRL